MALLFWARTRILSTLMWCRTQDRDTFRPAAAPLVSSPSLWICHYSGSVHPKAPVLELRFDFLQCLWSPHWTFVKSNLALSLQQLHCFYSKINTPIYCRSLLESECRTNVGELGVTQIFFTAFIHLNRLLWIQYLLKCFGRDPFVPEQIWTWALSLSLVGEVLSCTAVPRECDTIIAKTHLKNTFNHSLSCNIMYWHYITCPVPACLHSLLPVL